MPEKVINMNADSLIERKQKATGVLQLSSINPSVDYRKEWNVDMKDFVCLTRDGELVSDSLYRVGGLNAPDLLKDEYFMLIKYVEAFYPEHILRMAKSTDPKHLEGRWCIIDKHGVEKVEFEQFKSPYLINDSCIYSIDHNYYNIETGEFYGNAYTSISSDEFIFLDNQFDKDKSKRGVMKINKKTGKFEIFKKSN